MSETTPAPPRVAIKGTRLAAAGGMVGLFSTLAAQLVALAELPAEIQMTLATLASVAVGALVMSIASWGRDQVAAGNAGILARMASMIGCVALALLVAGCASFDRVAVSSMAERWAGASGFAGEECDDMRAASGALVEGPNKDLWVLGAGGERKEQSEALDRISVRCDRATQLDATAPQAAGARSLFNRTWAAVAAAVQ